MLTPMDQERVADFVVRNGGPRAISLSPTTHLFYFCDGPWFKSPVVLVNKNGNYSRLLRAADGRYNIVKTWNGLCDYDQWMWVGRPDNEPEKVLAMVSHGPAIGKKECLSLFPKEAFAQGRRRACWRNHITRVAFDQASNRFTLMPEGDAPAVAFPGKPWESADAAAWCMSNLAAPVIDLPGAIENPYQRAVMAAGMVTALEDHPLYGAF